MLKVKSRHPSGDCQLTGKSLIVFPVFNGVVVSVVLIIDMHQHTTAKSSVLIYLYQQENRIEYIRMSRLIERFRGISTNE